LLYNQPFDQPSVPNASYLNGNPSTGTPGSIPPAAAIEYPQREIVNFINAVGLTPTNGDLTQLAEAVQTGNVVWAVDTGTVNNLAISLNPAPLVPPKFLIVVVGNTNTGASVITISGLGSYPITLSGVALAAGILNVNNIALLAFYNGGYQVVSAPPAITNPTTPVLQPGFNVLKGSSWNSNKLASWTAEQITAAVSLGGISYTGLNLSLAFNGNTTGPNGMDTGSMPTANDLSIYAIYNPSTLTWSTLGCAGAVSNGTIYTGAHMPAGYTASVLIWSGVTVAGVFNVFEQFGRTVWSGGQVMVGGYADNTLHWCSCAVVCPLNATWHAGLLDITSGVSNTIFLCPGLPGSVLGTLGQIGEQFLGSTYIGSTVNGNYGPMPFVNPQLLAYEMLAYGGTSGQIVVESYGF